MNSNVETYWSKIAEKFGDTRKWQELNRNEQDCIIQSINLLLAVLNRRVG